MAPPDEEEGWGRGPRPPSADWDTPSLWVQLDEHEVVQIDRPDGVRFRIGPIVAFEEIRAPRWIAIDEPGQPSARLDILRVAPANAPAAAFGVDWLTAPPLP